METTTEKERGVQLLGVRWAPLRVPLSSRLQTLSVAWWQSVLVFMPLYLLALAALLLFGAARYPPLLLAVPAYAAWMFVDRNTCDTGGRNRGRGYRSLRDWAVWHHFRDYFPVRLVKTADLPPDKNYVLCCYPHGLFGFGAACSFGTDALRVHELFPGTTPNLVTLRLNFFLPVLRECLLSQGLVSATESSLRSVLSDPRGGRLAVLLVGGAREAQLSDTGHYHIVLRRRRGFVRLALQHGAPLVPVFTFNEHRVLGQARGPLTDWVQDFSRRWLGFIPVLFKGRGFFQYSFGFVAHRRPLTVVVGEPIPVDRVAEPTADQISELSARFEKALVQLFNAHKETYHPGEDVRLLIEE